MPDPLQMRSSLPDSSPAEAVFGYATEAPTFGEALGAMFKQGVPAEERGLAIEQAEPESDENRRWDENMLHPQMPGIAGLAVEHPAPPSPPGLPTATTQPPPRVTTVPMDKAEAVR